MASTARKKAPAKRRALAACRGCEALEKQMGELMAENRRLVDLLTKRSGSTTNPFDRIATELEEETGTPTQEKKDEMLEKFGAVHMSDVFSAFRRVHGDPFRSVDEVLEESAAAAKDEA